MSALSTFEGSYGGDMARIADDTRLECKICWWVYDPAVGCESWQIPPGTPFTKLPKDWRCPSCDALPSGFMALDVTPEAAPVPVPAALAAAPEDKSEEFNHSIRQKEARALAERFEEAFRELHRGRMRDVPFLNQAIQVQAIGFRPYDDAVAGRCTLGVMLTPWFMNLVLVPEEAPEPAPQVGAKSMLAFPSGKYEFVWNNREETGPYRACSLFSPVSEFASQLQAVEIGVEILKALFQEEHREEGTRAAEIRAIREEEIRRQEEAEAAQAAAEANKAAAEAKQAAGEAAKTEAQTDAAAQPVDEEAATPSRRALFVPRARSKREPSEPALAEGSPREGETPA